MTGQSPGVLLLALLLAGASAGGCAARGGGLAGDAGATWTLIWADEFNGTDGSRPDPARWVFDVGAGTASNHELQQYTGAPDNARIEDGALVITARREIPASDKRPGTEAAVPRYTSARLKTQGRFTTTHGRVEARIRIPFGQGLWPAFWMLGADIGRVDWPACGEIDIMENVGKEPATVYGTVHGPGYSGEQGVGIKASLGNGRLADGFHVYAVEWDASGIGFFLDGQSYGRITAASLPAGASWVFDHPFFLLLNVAVGGDWPGNPDASTSFPQEMRVDYVRVYRRNR